MLDQITSYLLAIIPSVVSIIGVVGAVIYNIKKSTSSYRKNEETLKELISKDRQDIKEIRESVNVILSENAALKRENRQLKNFIRHVKDTEDEK